MNMSFSSAPNRATSVGVNGLKYRDVLAPFQVAEQTKKDAEVGSSKDGEKKTPAGPSIREIEEIVEAARCGARTETEERLQGQYELKIQEAALRIGRTIDSFEREKSDYFGRVESEVVHLALAISAKILHRESQVDPMLVGALVRFAIEKLNDGSRVSVRVASAEVEKWREYMRHCSKAATIDVVEDDHLDASDAVLETNLGSANFSVDAQLKEIEQGFFDLLAHRPDSK